MPTYSFTRTREQMRDMIARKLSVKEEGQSLSAEEATIIYEGMDLRLKELHVLGLLWWQVSGAATDVALSAGAATSSLSAVTDYLFPITLKLRNGTEDQDIDIISHREYQDIPEKAERGEPRKAFFSGSTVYLWPVPDVAYTAKLTYQAVAADVENGTAPDVPVSCLRSLADLVAADLADDFQVTDSKAARLLQKVGPAMATIRAVTQERVDATTVTPSWY